MRVSREIDSFIRCMPKVELHLHIEGTFEADHVMSIAQRNGVKLVIGGVPIKSTEQLRALYKFSCLLEFLDLYYACMSVLLHEQDFFDLAMAYFRRCKDENIIHTEIFFDPQAHTDRGVPYSVVSDGLHRAVKTAATELGVSAVLILSFLRCHSEESADAILTMALQDPFRGRILGVGLDSAERGNPPEKFKNVFARAIAHGLLPVSHAGEEGGPESVLGAIQSLHVRRIDHGLATMEDPDVCALVAQRQIPLTVCPLSNVCLQVSPNMSAHPIADMLDAGLAVTINSDDPAYFGGYLNENILSCLKNTPLTALGAVKCMENAFRGVLVSPRKRHQLQQRFYGFLSRHPIPPS